VDVFFELRELRIGSSNLRLLLRWMSQPGTGEQALRIAETCGASASVTCTDPVVEMIKPHPSRRAP